MLLRALLGEAGDGGAHGDDDGNDHDDDDGDDDDDDAREHQLHEH